MMEARDVVSNLREEEFSMAKTTTIVVIADLHGRVLAAHLAGDAKKVATEGEPATALLPLEGQHALTVEIPNEVLELPGPCLHRLFSEMKIHWPGEAALPKMEIAKTHK
jgi:hypothetical protein